MVGADNRPEGRFLGDRRTSWAMALLLTAGMACSEAIEPTGTSGDGRGEPTPFGTAHRPAFEGIQGRWGRAGPAAGGEVFTTAEDRILRDGQPFEVRGVVYVPGYPGFLPWEIEDDWGLPERLSASIDRDIAQIAELGANTVRLWGAPRHSYEAIKSSGRLYILQTIWIDPDVADLHDARFKEMTRAYIRTVVDRIHGVFYDRPPPLIGYVLGNELSEPTIRSTNAAHPGLTSFTGRHVKTDATLNASEVFLAEMADYLKEYETDRYGGTHLVTYANMIRTADLIDTPFLDFRSHNVYIYDVPYFRPGTSAGSSSGTLLQGWVEELKARFPDRPLLVSETGLSVSPNAPHRGPPHYGYGGNTETEQAQVLLQNLDDIARARPPTAGVVVHEFLDAWWKFGLEDSYSQDPDDVEEWFGIVRLTGT